MSPRKKQKLCSVACRAAARRGQRLNGQQVTCAHCDGVFWVAAHRLATVKYCSRSCLAKVHLAENGFRFPSGRTRMATPYRQIRVAGVRRREHRVVMERVLGRPLLPTEHVHHKNGDGHDNRPDNLELVEPSAHNRSHTLDRVRRLRQTA